MYLFLSLIISFFFSLRFGTCDFSDDIGFDVSSTSQACRTALNTTGQYISASEAYDCLISTPFDKSVATALLSYWRDTLLFQSTLGYLKDPPRGYQQAPVDLLSGFDLIQGQIDTGVFTNQYTFEAAVQQLLYSAHDSHVSLDGGVIGVFSFSCPVALTSVSWDGFEVPKVYVAYDLVNAGASEDVYDYSPVRLINNIPAETYLAQFASRNVLGSVEPHGDWNQLMYSYAGAIQGGLDNFRSTIFYPGKTITFTFWNGTVYEYEWLASRSKSLSGPLVLNGEDFYDYFVLKVDTPSDIAIYGPLPEESVSPDPSSTASTAPMSTTQAINDGYKGWGFSYPQVADVAQRHLGLGGIVTGYFLRDSNLGVLSIPSFDLNPMDKLGFSEAVGSFLQQAKETGMTKILVDLQRNGGGDQLLATDTFKHFFPNIDPFSGMRSRSFDTADVLGNTLTQYYIGNNQTLDDTIKKQYINSPWAISSELDAGTGKSFDSWAEYYGPQPEGNNGFSAVSRYNLSDATFTEAAVGTVVYGYDNRTSNTAPPFNAQDIAILTDGTCASTCDLFVEMMHHEAGVRTVVVGGLPQLGPMQARGGTRGALRYSSDQLDQDIAVARRFNGTALQNIPDRSDIYSAVTNLKFNLRDQVRKGENFPLQFAYEAADCRVYFTPDTVNNYTALWEYAASAIFFNASTCVAHSAEHNNTMQTDQWGPSPEQKASWAASNLGNAPEWTEVNTLSLQDLASRKKGYNKDERVLQKVSNEYCYSVACRAPAVCVQVETCLQGVPQFGYQCLQPCDSNKRCFTQVAGLSAGGEQQQLTCQVDGLCYPQFSLAEQRCFQNRAQPSVGTIHRISSPSLQQNTGGGSQNAPGGGGQNRQSAPANPPAPGRRPPASNPGSSQKGPDN